jgi:hypothetical protein
MARTDNVQRIDSRLSNQVIGVCIDEVQTGTRSPVSKQASLHM